MNSLRAVRLALEVLANVCYVEEEEEEEGGWEDEEEEEEMVGDLMEEEREGEQSSAAPGQLASALTAVLEHGLHEKVCVLQANHTHYHTSNTNCRCGRSLMRLTQHYINFVLP